jgi:hypothetical protein
MGVIVIVFAIFAKRKRIAAILAGRRDGCHIAGSDIVSVIHGALRPCIRPLITVRFS